MTSSARMCAQGRATTILNEDFGEAAPDAA